MVKDNTILIWKYLRPLLTENEELQEAMNVTKIYPLVYNDTEVTYPFIIYSRDNITPQYTKGIYGGWYNSMLIAVHVYSNDYTESVNIANLVRNALEWKTFQNEEIKIDPIELQSCNEQFTEDGFKQSLFFVVTAE